MPELLPLAGSALAGLAVLGVGWFVQVILRSETEEAKPFTTIATRQESQSIQPQDIIDMGTGPLAEEILGSKLSNATRTVFIAGAITASVYSLIRNYMPPNVALEVLANPALGGKTQLFSIAHKYATRVKTTPEITKDAITLFNVDDENALLLRKDNNGVLMARDISVAQKLTVKNRAIWLRATTYTA